MITQTIESEEGVELLVQHNTTDLIVEYETEAPIMIEENLDHFNKRITISSQLHYENVLTFINITPVKQESIALYWIQNGSKQIFENVSYIDADQDGLIEQLQWIVPHLSNQTFEITITVLNAQSYPMVGGFWTVRLNTSGTADLKITPYDLTTFLPEPNDYGDLEDDLEFNEFLCENNSMKPSIWILTPNICLELGNISCYEENNETYVKYDELMQTTLSIDMTSLYIYNYTCNETSYLKNIVRTTGAHHILFEYGPGNDTAHNWALKNATSTTVNATASIRRPSGNMTGITGNYLLLNHTTENTETWHNTTWLLNYSKDCQEEGNYEVFVELLNLGNSRAEKDLTGINEAITIWVDTCKINGSGRATCSVHADSKNVNADKTFGGKLELMNNNCNITSVTDNGNGYWTQNGSSSCPSPSCGEWIEFYQTVGTSDNEDDLTFIVSCTNDTAILINVSETCGLESCGEATINLGGYDACANPTCTDNHTYVGNDTVESLGGFDLLNYEIGIIDVWGWSTVSTYNINWDSSQQDCDCFHNDTGYWNIGGDISTCCEDDASGENKTTRVVSATMDNGYSNSTSDNGCCNADNKCLNNDTCYANATVNHNADGDSDNDFCLEGSWYDCNSDSECGTGYYCNNNDCEVSTITINFTNPTPNHDSRQINNTVTINVTVTSPNNVDTCTLEWQGANESMTRVGSGTSVTCNKTKTTTDGTTYTYKVWANNSVGGIGNSTTRNFTENSKPSITANTLTSTSGNNATTDNLTINITSTDGENDIVRNITDWRVGGTSIAVLNMPFDTNITSTASGAIKDYSTYTNHGQLGGGTAANAPTWTSSGKVGGGYIFDGSNDYINVPFNKDLPSGTIEMWIKSIGNTGATQIFFEGDGSAAGSSPSFEGTATSMTFYVNNTCSLNVAYTQNVWTHFIGTWSSTENKLYKNGVEAGSGACTHTEIGFSKFVVGGRSGSNPANATIDEVKIYNRSLSPEEITMEYNAGLANHHTRVLASNETNKGETWTVATTPSDGYEDGITNISNSLTIIDSTPAVTLLTPTNGQLLQSWDNRTPTFTWSGTDADGDPLNYTIWVAENSGFSTIHKTRLTGQNETFTLNQSDEVDPDAVYWWIVEAFDGTNRANATSSFNFTLESYLALSLSVSSINFSSLEIGQTDNTSDDSPTPFTLVNDGNVYVNITINATTLWSDPIATLGTRYYQFKADYTGRGGGSGEFSSGTSQTSWMNMSGTPLNLVKEFDFHNGNDDALTDLLVEVPGNEPSGNKNSTIQFTTQ